MHYAASSSPITSVFISIIVYRNPTAIWRYESVYVAHSSDSFAILHRRLPAKFHIDFVTGRPRERQMHLHGDNSVNGHYTDTDINRNRGTCTGCIMAQIIEHQQIHIDTSAYILTPGPRISCSPILFS